MIPPRRESWPGNSTAGVGMKTGFRPANGKALDLVLNLVAHMQPFEPFLRAVPAWAAARPECW